mmetsp:Transcript_33979/g.52954  ORF Transcript_33979/g.52954 Transcript_33979/m.52954 type:complete len:114 (-) Transcript_33979:75-416(-)
MEQVDFILSLITEAFAAKNKQVKIVRREVRLSMALKNTLEAFQTEEGEPYYVIGGTDTYFLADLARQHGGIWDLSNKVWEGVSLEAKTEIQDLCEKFGIPLEIIEDEVDQESD